MSAISLNINDKIKIENEDFTVIGLVDFKQSPNYHWSEYYLKNNNNEIKYLSIEKSQDDFVFILYEDYLEIVENANSIIVNDITFKFLEQGTQKVIAVQGNVDLNKYDTGTFFDYVSDGEHYFSIEEWNYEKDYYFGKTINKSDIVLDNNKSIIKENYSSFGTFDAKTELMEFYINDKISLNNKVYKVAGKMVLCQGSYSWTEYKVIGEDIKWLSVEKSEGEGLYSLFENISQSEFDNKIKNLPMIESGSAYVSQSVRVDSIVGEEVTFSDYEVGENEYCTKEVWTGDGTETEYSKGYYIDDNNIEILERGNPNTPNISFKGISVSSIIFLFIGIAIFQSLVIRPPDFLFKRNIFSKYLKSSSDFTYLTSVTNVNKKDLKANIYETSIPKEDVVLKLIHSYPEQIVSIDINSETDSITDLNIIENFKFENEAIIYTKYENIIIYENIKGGIYLQVSPNKFITNSSGEVYLPKNEDVYDFSYASISSHDNYTTSNSSSHRVISRPYRIRLSSLRQESISSRQSSGGGTSSGK